MLSVLPHLVWWPTLGEPVWIADHDELFYLAVGAQSYFNHPTYPSDPVRVAGPLRVPTVQIHPTLRCNLLCMHCYSNSGPHARAELPVAAVCQTIVDASALGYEVVS